MIKGRPEWAALFLLEQTMNWTDKLRKLGEAHAIHGVAPALDAPDEIWSAYLELRLNLLQIGAKLNDRILLDRRWPRAAAYLLGKGTDPERLVLQ